MRAYDRGWWQGFGAGATVALLLVGVACVFGPVAEAVLP